MRGTDTDLYDTDSFAGTPEQVLTAPLEGPNSPFFEDPR